jgi:tRNA(fMet)-specific endonuclease VapC
MKYLLDTCVISDFIKGESNTLNQIKNTSPSEIAVSTITVMEIQYGLTLNPKYAKTIQPIISDFLAPITILDFTEDDARQAAIARALLKQQGCPIGSYDILLAGTALNHRLIFVSANTKEFTRVSGLKLEDWRLNPQHNK